MKKYVRSDIRSYGRKITGHSGIEVSEGYREIQEDEEGYLDHLWTLTDEEDGVTFHVLDDYYWALEEVENRLLDDYDVSAFLFLLEKGVFPATQRISLKTDNSSGLQEARLSCTFTDRESLRECFEELESIRSAAEKAGYHDLKVPYIVRYRHPLRGVVEYDSDEGDTEGVIGGLGDAAYRQMLDNYLSCALDYRFEQALGEFSAQEIDALVHAPQSVRIYKKSGKDSADIDASDTAAPEGAATKAAAEELTGETNTAAEHPDRQYYEGVIANEKYAGISFGTLYELLKTEGRNPQGTPWHYTFTGPEGNLYEISYDFNDLSGFNDSQGKLKKGYYYIRDDRKVRMDNYYANHFSASRIEELTGLKVAEDRPYLKE